MRLGERVKPLLLATLLTFMVGSYFVSDTFTRGRSFNGVSFPYEFVAQAVCLSRPDNEHAACYASVAEAFVPTNLACTSTLRDLSLCKKPAKGTKKKRENSWYARRASLYQEQTQSLLNPNVFVQSRLLTHFSGATPNNQVHLEPQLQRRGFSSEEIARLGLGNQDPTEQHPAPPGGGEGEGQGGKGERSEGSAAGGKKAGVVPEEAGGDGGGDGGGAGPKVEVVEGPKDRDSIAR